jgi:hypothetical protein
VICPSPVTFDTATIAKGSVSIVPVPVVTELSEGDGPPTLPPVHTSEIGGGPAAAPLATPPPGETVMTLQVGTCVVVVVVTVGAVGGSNSYETLKLPELVVALKAEITCCSATPRVRCADAFFVGLAVGPLDERATATGTASAAMHATPAAVAHMRRRLTRRDETPGESSNQRPSCSWLSDMA